MENFDVKPNEEVCFNCKHLAWMIGIGQGLRCSNSKKGPNPEVIPSVRHTCELFDLKDGLKPLGSESQELNP